MPIYMPQSAVTRFTLDSEGNIGKPVGPEESNDPPSPASSTHTADSSRNRVRLPFFPVGVRPTRVSCGR